MVAQSQSTAFHKEEVRKVLEAVRQSAIGAARKGHPSRHSPAMWSKLSGSSVSNWCEAGGNASNSIRQIHDFYGWMAKRGKHGGCAGALYRSTAFMKLEPGHRNGSKGLDKNIHIEHLIPVADLKKILSYEVAQMKTPGDFHRILMSHSLCVALTAKEENNFRKAGGPSSRNEAIGSQGERKSDAPFRRYCTLSNYLEARNQDFGIINVITGEQINLQTFSFQDHEKTMNDASQMVTGGSGPMLYSLELFDCRLWCPT